jgi:hydrogenase maturation protein HypF
MKLIFKGVVQGVGFRPTIYRIATQLGLKGYVLNKGSEVEVVIDRDVKKFLTLVSQELPSIASITKVVQQPDTRTFHDFQILHSKQGEKMSPIPPDVATCDDCLHDIFDARNRRYLYPFTNCTVCGARYSLIRDVPYDRERTAMKEFCLCPECKQEYCTPGDRRYNAQTISCPRCGPRYHLYDKKGKDLGAEDAIKRFAGFIDQGKIGVMKSWGGMHLCCRIDRIKEFRAWYKRPQKAFAVMVRDIKTAERYSKISADERRLLLSNKRPIVLVTKKDNEEISPGLDSIGLYLPYTATHHLLFSFLASDAVIMTSANIPGEPMIITNEEAFSLNADTYLLHNRMIPNRIDDSVVRLYKNHTFFLRKSRGYVPDPIPVPYSTRILSVGAGENIAGALSTNTMLYATQYIGNSAYYQTLDFLESSLRHLMRLSMNKPGLDAVAMDLHPGYETRIVAERFAKEYDVPCVEVQHHWAHAVSLLLDNHQEESVVLTLDGLGYGTDHTFWGGEILLSRVDMFERIGHLQTIPLLGGDQAIRDPRRLVFAIFNILGKQKMFSGDQADILEKMMPRAPQTSSLGRVLDALSCYLDICSIRTYDGEPAMKLERYLAKGEPIYKFEATVKNNVINTVDLFRQLDDSIPSCLTEKKKADFATSFVTPLVNAMVDLAVDAAEHHYIKTIGVTGGVSYNIPITKMIETRVRQKRLSLLVHHRIPNGDGGIAVGQNVIVGHQTKT